MPLRRQRAHTTSAAIQDEARRTVEQQIGVRLQGLRKAKGVTLEVLSESTGFTKGYLSKIENGKQVPPIASLLRIAQALSIDITYFLGSEPPPDVEDERICVVRADRRRSIIRGGSSFGYDYESLSDGKQGRHMEPFVFTWPSAPARDVFFEHAGEEFVFVLSGRVELEIDSAVFVLEPGDCIYFDASLPHRGRSLGAEAKSLVVTYTPDQKTAHRNSAKEK